MNTQVTPEQIDGLINAWVQLDAAVTTYGPGLLLAAAVAAAWWLCTRTAGAIYDRIAAAHQRRGIRRLEQYANQASERGRADIRDPREETP